MRVKLKISLPSRMARELYPGDETAAVEIHLVESNDGDLYRQMVQPTIKNYARKMKKGVYDRTLALKGLQNNLVVEAIRRYKRDQGDIGPVSAAVKRRIAELWLPQIQEEVEYMVREGEV